MSSVLRIPILCILFVLLWSSGWIGSKYLLSYGSALGVLVWRYLLVVSAGIVALITAMQPLLILAIAFPVLHERINIKQFLGIVLGLISVVFVVGEKISLGGSVLIYSLAFLSVPSLTFASVFSRYSEKQNSISMYKVTPLLLVLFMQCSAALVGFSILTWAFGSFSLTLTSELLMSMGYMVISVSIGSCFLYFLLLRELSAVKVASLVYMTPPVTMVLGWAWFHEALSSVDLIGLFMAMLAVSMVVLGGKKTSRKKYFQLSRF